MIIKLAIRTLLAMLNSRLLNHTPCRYDFVGNMDNFSRADIESSLRQEPEMTLREYLTVADRFKSCPISRVGITAIEPDGTYTQNVDFKLWINQPIHSCPKCGNTGAVKCEHWKSGGAL